MNEMVDDLWFARTVGLKLWGFDHNHLNIKDRFGLLAQFHGKGEPHGSKGFFPENQIYYAIITQEDDNWNDSLHALITVMGGVETIKSFINEVEPKKYWFVINAPKSDLHSNNSKSFSADTMGLVSSLDCDIGFNFFDID